MLSAKARQKRKDANAISEEQTEVGDRLYQSSERASGGDCRVKRGEGREMQETHSQPLLPSGTSRCLP